MNKSEAMFDAWLTHTKPIVAVIVIEHLSDAETLINSLKQDGIQLVEITLRTAVAIEAIAALSNQYPEMIVGAGTVLNAQQVDQVAAVGGRFVVSPGFSASIADRAEEQGLAYLPGAATATEILMALDRGYQFLKFFPAAQAGGIEMLKAFSKPFPQVTFCPTGGINEASYREYLELSNVRCVGGSWFVPKET